jgi:hypothetical protein
MFKYPRTDCNVIAAQGSGYVFDGFTSVETNLVGPNSEWMATQLHNGHLHGVASPRRRLLEEQRHTESIEAARNDGSPSEIEDVAQFSCGEVIDLKKMSHNYALER